MTYAVSDRRTPLDRFLSPEPYDSTGHDLGVVFNEGVRASAHYFEPATILRRGQILESVFRRLVHEWTEDTELESSMRKITSHPAYRRIISLGEEMLPLILHD